LNIENIIKSHGVGGNTDIKLEGVEKKIVGEYLPISQITRSGTTATATISGHNLINGSLLEIVDADQIEYNGEHTVTVVDMDNVSFSVSDTAITPATGSFYGIEKKWFWYHKRRY